jgi:NAD(P)H-hydrate epimerase
MKILSAEEMARTDRETAEQHGVSMATLMHNAGGAVARFARAQYPEGQRVTVLCGTGNNGGDGFVAAKALVDEGIAVAVVLAGAEEKLHGEAADAYALLHGTTAAVFHLGDGGDLPGLDALLSGADLLIDAITGTGFKAPLRGVAAQLRDRVRGMKVPVLAVDLPSGWEADATEQTAEDAFRADAVVTFTAPKMAHVFGHLTSTVFGPVVVTSIGSPDAAIRSDGKIVWAGALKSVTEAPRAINSNKGQYGKVLLVGGSLGKAGAPAMASLACLRAGAGLVTAAVPSGVLSTVAAIAPELMCSPLPQDAAGSVSLAAADAVLKLAEKMDVLAIGPGLSTEGESVEFVRRLIAETTLPVVLDADGLNAFAGRDNLLRGEKRTLVLTPHPGEMARLLGVSVKEVEADRVHLARKFATEHQVTLVLKGWRTLIAHPDGTVAVNTSGHPAMAKGGSGDILTGIVAAMLGQYGDNVADAVNAAVYLHGLAGAFAARKADEHTVLATDTVRHLSDAFRYRTQDREGFTWIAGLPKKKWGRGA